MGCLLGRRRSEGARRRYAASNRYRGGGRGCALGGDALLVGCGSRRRFREGYELGLEQGKKDAPVINIVWGLLGGVIAFGVAAFSAPPDPSAVRMQQLDGKSADFKEGYLEGYSQGRQNMRLLYIGGGAVLPTLLLLVLLGM